MSSHLTPVLIPGSGLGPWIWDDVDVAGAVAVDYPAALRESGSLDDYAAEVVRQLDAASAGRVVLVAHSIGAVVAHAVAALAPGRVEGVLAVSGVVPADGRSFFSAFGPPQSIVASVVVRLAGTRPPESMLRKGLAAGLGPTVTDRVVESFVPESQRLFRDRMPALDPAARRGYVLTTDDVEVPLARQRVFADRLAATWRSELATGHLPMLQDPSGCRDAILGFLASGPDH